MSRRKIEGTVLSFSRDEFAEMTVAEKDGIRSLYFRDGIMQSCIKLADPSDLLMDYSQAMMTALIFTPQPQRLLLVGLGGGSLVNFLLRHCPTCTLDVVEISGEVIRLSRQFFHVPENESRLHIILSDGLQYIERMVPEGYRYDLILLDAFDDGGPSTSIMHESFMISCRNVLSPAGLLAVNLWTRPKDGFPLIHEMIDKVFQQKTVPLRLGDANQNGIVFGFNNSSFTTDFSALKAEARCMQKKTGVNFPAFLMRMRRECLLLNQAP